MVSGPIAKTGKRLRRQRDGIASVEFAIVLPVLVLMLFGAIEFGRLLVDYQLANKSARDAIRYLSRVHDAGFTDICPAGGFLWPNVAPSQPVRNAVNLAMTGSVNAPAGPGDYLLGYWIKRETIEIRVSCNPKGTFSGAFQYNELYIPELTMTATDYWKRNCWTSTECEEKYVTDVIRWLGDGRIVYESDFPHPDSKYPLSTQTFLNLIPDQLSDESKRKILWDNAIDLYRLPDAYIPSALHDVAPQHKSTNGAGRGAPAQA